MICPVCGKPAHRFEYYNGSTRRHHSVLQCSSDLCFFEMHMSGANAELAVENIEAIYNALIRGYERREG